MTTVYAFRRSLDMCKQTDNPFARQSTLTRGVLFQAGAGCWDGPAFLSGQIACPPACLVLPTSSSFLSVILLLPHPHTHAHTHRRYGPPLGQACTTVPDSPRPGRGTLRLVHRHREGALRPLLLSASNDIRCAYTSGKTRRRKPVLMRSASAVQAARRKLAVSET